jgi:TPR repeat protein
MWFHRKKDDGGEEQYAAGMARLNEKSSRADQAAFAHFSKAVQCGHVEALLELGFSYFKGRGVEKSEGKATEYYKLASDKGSANAAFNLAVMAMKGEGMRVNLSLAKQWGLLAEQRGNPRASGLLVMINYGLETERMEAEAMAAAARGWRLGFGKVE